MSRWWRVARVLVPGVLVAVLLVFQAAVVIGTATSASAHVALMSSEPAEQAALPRTPATVWLVFSGQVRERGSRIEVLDASGRRVDTGQITDDGPRISTGLAGDAGTGAFTVRWSITSEDLHVVTGEFGFTVDPTATDPAATDLAAAAAPEPATSRNDTAALPDPGGSPGPDRSDGVPWVAALKAFYVLLAGLAAGLGIVAAASWSRGDVTLRPGAPVLRTATAGAALAVLATTVAFDVRGVGLPSLPVGLAWAGSAAGLVLLAAPSRGGRWQLLARTGAGLVIAGSAIVGHALELPRPVVTIVLLGVHIACMVVWVAAVVTIGVLTVTGRQAFVDRFARWATTAVPIGLLAGVLVAVNETGSPGRLAQPSTFTALLGIKTLLALVAIGLAVLARRRGRLRLLAAESVVLVAALAVSGVLAQTNPLDAAQTTRAVQIGSRVAAVECPALRTGQVRCRISLFTPSTERDIAVQKLSVQLTSGALASRRYDLTRTADGFTLEAPDVVRSGSWLLQLSYRLTAADLGDATVPLTVS